jgi:DNA helicase IV
MQFSRTTEQRFAPVEAARLRTVDGRAIDDATPWQNAHTIDAEDFAVLFELNRLKVGTDATEAASLQTYDHVVIDEAQEMSALELALLGRAVRASGALTVAGDDKQQVDETTTFTGWPGAMRELGASDYAAVELQASYRCPPPVEWLARGLFTPSREPAPTPAEGEAPLLWTRYRTEAHRNAGLIETLVDFRDRDLQAAIAIVCRHPQSAERMHRELSMGLDVRLALDGQFRFSPGVSVTCVDEVKGLEFDVVIVPDLSPSSYPADLRSRKALYVAATRATHQLWLVTAGTWSPLVLGRTPAARASTAVRASPSEADPPSRGSPARP